MDAHALDLHIYLHTMMHSDDKIYSAIVRYRLAVCMCITYLGEDGIDVGEGDVHRVAPQPPSAQYVLELPLGQLLDRPQVVRRHPSALPTCCRWGVT